MLRHSRDRGSGGGGMCGFLTEFQRIIEPQTKHVAEDREVSLLEHEEDFGQNDPPNPPDVAAPAPPRPGAGGGHERTADP